MGYADVSVLAIVCRNCGRIRALPKTSSGAHRQLKVLSFTECPFCHQKAQVVYAPTYLDKKPKIGDDFRALEAARDRARGLR